jgi:hypothetical protein
LSIAGARRKFRYIEEEQQKKDKTSTTQNHRGAKAPEYKIGYSSSEFFGADKWLYVDPNYLEQFSA